MAALADIPKYARNNFFNNIIDPSGTVVQDLTSFKFYDFPTFVSNSPFPMYGVSDADVGALDLISYKVYNRKHQFWWILGLANKVMDPFNDLLAGMVLIVIDQNVIDNFYQLKQPGARIKAVQLS